MFACSGPGAGQAIAENIRTAEVHAGVLALLMLISLALAWRYRTRIVPRILLVMLAIHPAWTISAISGDCGYLKRDASWLCSVIACFALVWQGVLTFTTRPSAPPPDATSN